MISIGPTVLSRELLPVWTQVAEESLDDVKVGVSNGERGTSESTRAILGTTASPIHHFLV